MQSNVDHGHIRRKSPPAGMVGRRACGPSRSQTRAAHRFSSQASVLSARRRKARDHTCRMQQVRLAGRLFPRRSHRLSRCRAMPNLLNHLTAPNCSRLALIGIGAEFITSSRSRARGNSTAAGLQDNDVQLLKPQSRRSYRRVIKAAIIAACVALLLTRDDGPSAS